MIKVFDEMVDGKRVVKYRMTDEDKEKAREMRERLEELRNKKRENE